MNLCKLTALDNEFIVCVSGYHNFQLAGISEIDVNPIAC